MPELIFTESYEKKAKKFIKTHPELLSQYEKTLKLIEINPSHPSLRLHKLEGKLADLYRVLINISYRVSLEFTITEDEIILINICSHNELYGH